METPTVSFYVYLGKLPLQTLAIIFVLLLSYVTFFNYGQVHIVLQALMKDTSQS